MGTSILGRSWDAGVVFFSSFSPSFYFFSFSPGGGDLRVHPVCIREEKRSEKTVALIASLMEHLAASDPAFVMMSEGEKASGAEVR